MFKRQAVGDTETDIISTYSLVVNIVQTRTYLCRTTAHSSLYHPQTQAYINVSVFNHMLLLPVFFLIL